MYEENAGNAIAVIGKDIDDNNDTMIEIGIVTELNDIERLKILIQISFEPMYN